MTSSRAFAAAPLIVAVVVSVVMGTIVRRGSTASPKGSAATLARMENETVAVVEPHEIELVQDELLDELLVEEISIDGMCGVY